MQSTDLHVDEASIQDLPGYKVIMKAVIKHQIQILIEQLSEATGDESILLTASVVDGTTCHLGSRCGKTYLDGQEEIKSQFLNFVRKLYQNEKSGEKITSVNKKLEDVIVYPKENDLVPCKNPCTMTSNQRTYFMRPVVEQFSRGQAEAPIQSSVRIKNASLEVESPLHKKSGTHEIKQRIIIPRPAYRLCNTSQVETSQQRKTCTTETNNGVLSLGQAAQWYPSGQEESHQKKNVCTIIPKKGAPPLPMNTVVLNSGILPQMQGQFALVPHVVLGSLGTSEGRENLKAAEVATSHNEIKVGSKRSAADVRKRKLVVSDGVLEGRMDSEEEQSDSAIPGPVPVKCMPVIPVSGPIPVVRNHDSSRNGVLGLPVPKLEPEDTFGAQEGDEGSTKSPGAESDSLNLGYIVVKKEVEVDDEEEEAGIAEEVDPDWEPGEWETAEEENQDSDWEPPVKKKQRKSSDSSSVSSQVNECGVETPSDAMVPTSSHEDIETTLSTDQPPVEPEINSDQQKTPVEKPRFKVVTEEEMKMMENPTKHSLSTQRNTKWGTKLFQAWSRETFGDDTDFENIEAEDLNLKLQKFYLAATPKEVEHRKKNMPELQASEYRKNTLKNVRAAINRHLKDIGRPFDITKDKEFSPANKCLDGKILHNRKQGAYVPVQHKEISAADLLKIHIYLGTNSHPVVLMYKVWFDLSFHFNPKALAFHQHLSLKSFEFLKDEKGVEHAILTDDTKQEIRKALFNEEASLNRVLYATGSETCPVKSLKLLIEKTPPECSSLFNNCSDEALSTPEIHQYWYRNRPVKSYHFLKFMSKICGNAKCSQLYTTQCLRATAAKAMNGGLQIGRVEATIGTVRLSQSKQQMLLPKPQ